MEISDKHQRDKTTDHVYVLMRAVLGKDVVTIS